MQTEELILIQNTRNVIFNILAHVFADIPDEGRDKLVGDTHEFLLETCRNSSNPDLIKGAEALAAFYSGHCGLEETRYQRSLEYTNLFLMGAKNIGIHESVYLSPEHLLMRDQWFEVKKAYAAEKFRIADGSTKMEDHLSLELEFMAHLSGKAAVKLEESDYEGTERCIELQNSFYNEHIMKWVPDFCELVIKNERDEDTGFYTAFALILRGFLAEDQRFVDNLMN